MDEAVFDQSLHATSMWPTVCGMSPHGKTQTLPPGPESRQGARAAFVMSQVFHAPSIDAERGTRATRPVVVENAQYAWTNQESTVLAQLHPDLVHDYREALDAAAIARLAPLLEQVWTEHGFQVRWGTWKQADDHMRSTRGLDRTTYWAITDEACSRLDVDQLLADARLVDLARTTYAD